MLNASDLEPLALPANTGMWDVHAFSVIDSTNEEVKRALRARCIEGFCATSLYQSGGYGRQGRAWKSPVGGLYTSFALRPQVDMRDLPTLSLALSLAIYAAVERAAAPAGLRLKWPNDVLCDAGKLCGISLEAVAGGVCVGVGINAFRPVEQVAVGGKYSPAYLFEGEAGESLLPDQRTSMEALLAALLEEVELRYRQWYKGGFAACRSEYETHLAYVGSRAALETIEGDALVEGTIRGVDEQGRLLVQTDDGRIISAASGEVHVAAIGDLA